MNGYMNGHMNGLENSVMSDMSDMSDTSNTSDTSDTSSNILLSMHPHFDTCQSDYEDIHLQKDLTVINVIGFFVYFILFVIIIPFFIFRYCSTEVLLVYFANIDNIATVISFKNGPFDIGIFRYLYLDNRPLLGFINQSIINYIVLIAISYIITSRAVKSGNIHNGVAAISIILLTTYLLPSRFISTLMHAFYNTFTRDLDISRYRVVRYITYIFGFIVAFILIMFEAFLVKIFSKHISRFLETMLSKILKL